MIWSGEPLAEAREWIEIWRAREERVGGQFSLVILLIVVGWLACLLLLHHEHVDHFILIGVNLLLILRMRMGMSKAVVRGLVAVQLDARNCNGVVVRARRRRQATEASVAGPRVLEPNLHNSRRIIDALAELSYLAFTRLWIALVF